MRLKLTLWLWAFVCVFCCYPKAFAKQTTAVVLSGGGARSLAHIGFLQYLEENNIKIDYIGGTSGGALVSAFYAAGYSVQQIKELFLRSDLGWERGTFKPTYGFTAYNGPQNHNSSVFDLYLKGFAAQHFIPDNFIAKDPLFLGLIQYLGDRQVAAQKGSFDHFFIPFRCYAVETKSHRSVGLKKGDLVRSLLASMAYPFYFSPQTIDSLTFVDGGIYDNFPIYPMKEEFSPSLILGSQTSVRGSAKGDNSSFTRLMELIQKKEVDSFSSDVQTKIVVVKHENVVREYSTFDFSDPQDVIDQGYANAAKSLSGQLADFARQPRAVTQQKRIAYRHSLLPLLFSGLSITARGRAQRKYISGVLRLPRTKTIWQIEDFTEKFSKLFTDPRFSHFSFDILPDVKDSIYRRLGISHYDFSQHNVQVGGGIMGGQNGGVYNLFAGYAYNYFLLSTLLQTRVEAVLSNFNNEISLHQRTDISFPFVNTMLLSGRFSRVNYYNWQSAFAVQNSVRFFMSKGREFQAKWSVPVRRELMFSVIGNYQLNTLVYYNNGIVRPNIDSTDEADVKISQAKVALHYNTLDHKQYPSQGTHFLFSAEYNKVNTAYHYQLSTAPKPPFQTAPNIHFDTVTNRPTDRTTYYLLHLYLETYAKISPYLSVGFLLDATFSNLFLQRDYFSSLALLPRFQPVTELNFLLTDDYVSPSYLGVGGKCIITPIAKLPTLSLRFEANFLYKQYNFVRTPITNELFSFEEQGAWELEEKMFLAPIVNGSVVWSNKYFPLGVTLYYYARDISQLPRDIFIGNRLHFYVNLAYTLHHKKSNVYHRFP